MPPLFELRSNAIEQHQKAHEEWKNVRELWFSMYGCPAMVDNVFYALSHQLESEMVYQATKFDVAVECIYQETGILGDPDDIPLHTKIIAYPMDIHVDEEFINIRNCVDYYIEQFELMFPNGDSYYKKQAVLGAIRKMTVNTRFKKLYNYRMRDSFSPNIESIIDKITKASPDIKCSILLRLIVSLFTCDKNANGITLIHDYYYDEELIKAFFSNIKHAVIFATKENLILRED